MSATEKKLGELHEKVADVLITALDGEELPGYDDPDTGEVVEAKRLPPSAAIIAAATKFLKDNEITCSRDKSDALDELQRQMEARRQKRRASSLDLEAARDQVPFMGNA